MFILATKSHKDTIIKSLCVPTLCVTLHKVNVCCLLRRRRRRRWIFNNDETKVIGIGSCSFPPARQFGFGFSDAPLAEWWRFSFCMLFTLKILRSSNVSFFPFMLVEPGLSWRFSSTEASGIWLLGSWRMGLLRTLYHWGHIGNNLSPVSVLLLTVLLLFHQI